MKELKYTLGEDNERYEEIQAINKYINIHGKDEKVQKLEQDLLKQDVKNLNDIVCFAIGVKQADVKALQKYFMEKVEERKDASYCGCFACYVKGADVKALQDAVIKYGDAATIKFFAYDVAKNNIKGIDMSALEDAIIKTGVSYEIDNFAHCVKGANREKLLNVEFGI